MSNARDHDNAIWRPSDGRIEASRLNAFVKWLHERNGQTFDSYDALWDWSVRDRAGFWASVWDYMQILSDDPYTAVYEGEDFLSTRWFQGARVNYAEHILRRERDNPERAALIRFSESRAAQTTSWEDLGQKVRRLATSFRQLGVEPGDRIVAYLPSTEEAVVALLATVAIGAVWAIAPPEFGSRTIIDRFGQIEPKVIVAANGYQFNGKVIDRREEVERIVEALPSLRHVVWVSNIHLDLPTAPGLGNHRWEALAESLPVPAGAFTFERVGSDHPLWILFSSGTTGLPKAIVHSHIGIIIEHLKAGALQTDTRPDTVSFFYTTTGWMLFNTVVSTLLHGATAVLYDGSPGYPDAGRLWSIAEEAGATVMGASPGLIDAMIKAGYNPAACHDLSRLRTVMTSGAPATPETFEWIYAHVKPDVQVASVSGGTELCGALVGANPWTPVRPGRIQGRQLGIAVDVWSEGGASLTGVMGELVVTAPFPSMPLKFWNDPDNRRFHESYFETFPGVWCHGDLMTIDPDGSCYIHGRSDATLNRGGIRIGTAEIYRTLDTLAFIRDALVVCAAGASQVERMYLFVQPKEADTLTEDQVALIRQALREHNSPRHVPDSVVAVPGIPYTLTGKRMEVPVRRLMNGADADTVASRDSMANPDIFGWYAHYALSLSRDSSS